MKLKIVLAVLFTLLIVGVIIKDSPNKQALNYNDAMFISRVNSTPIEFALSYYGVNETFTNGKSNPIVVSFFKDFADWVTNAKTTAWCSAFVNTIYASTGYEYSGKLDARSWLKIGEKTNNPQVGDVVVFWRNSPNSWQGHVAIFIGYSQDKKYINVLGGNQGNKVSIAQYPVTQLLGFRRLKYIRVPGGDERFETPLKLELK